jgi:hypothetical protein
MAVDMRQADEAENSETRSFEKDLEDLVLDGAAPDGEATEPEVLKAPDITVEVKVEKDGLPKKFVVTGASTFVVKINDMETHLTLNGSYCRTPNNTFSCVNKGPSGQATFQALLVPLPKPHAQFEVLRMHSGFLAEDVLVSQIGEPSYRALSEAEPQLIFDKVRAYLKGNVPHFVLFANKSRSS